MKAKSVVGFEFILCEGTSTTSSATVRPTMMVAALFVAFISTLKCRSKNAKSVYQSRNESLIAGSRNVRWTLLRRIKFNRNYNEERQQTKPRKMKIKIDNERPLSPTDARILVLSGVEFTFSIHCLFVLTDGQNSQGNIFENGISRAMLFSDAWRR